MLKYNLQRPYNGTNRKEIKDNIVARQAKVEEFEVPPGWSLEAVDFINSLLIRKQYQRLGSDKPGSAKKHSWFKNYDWESLKNKTIKSPFYGIVQI